MTESEKYKPIDLQALQVTMQETTEAMTVFHEQEWLDSTAIALEDDLNLRGFTGTKPDNLIEQILNNKMENLETDVAHFVDQDFVVHVVEGVVQRNEMYGLNLRDDNGVDLVDLYGEGCKFDSPTEEEVTSAVTTQLLDRAIENPERLPHDLRRLGEIIWEDQPNKLNSLADRLS